MNTKHLKIVNVVLTIFLVLSLLESGLVRADDEPTAQPSDVPTVVYETTEPDEQATDAPTAVSGDGSSTPVPDDTPKPGYTPGGTDTDKATETPAATDTVVPYGTPTPGDTPEVTETGTETPEAKASATATPTPTPPADDPADLASCGFSGTSNTEGWVEVSIPYSGGPDGAWWVLYFKSNGESNWQEWAGWQGQSGTWNAGEVFAPGQYDFRVDLLSFKEGVCGGGIEVPDPPNGGEATPPEVQESASAQLPEASETGNTNVEETIPDSEEVVQPECGRRVTSQQSPNGCKAVETRGGELWVVTLDGAKEWPVGQRGEAPIWLSNWAILFQAEDGELVLTDQFQSFVRHLGVQGTFVSLSADGEWVKYLGSDGQLMVVSIHGSAVGHGPADGPEFAGIAFP